MRCVNYTKNFIGCGVSNAEINAAINATLGLFTDNFNNSLQNNPNGGDAAVGLMCEPVIPGDCVVEPDRHFWEEGGHTVQAWVSRKRATAGLVNITGLTIGWLSQHFPADAVNCVVRYVNATNHINVSIDGGGTWGPNIILDGLATNDCIAVFGQPGPTGLPTMFLQRTAPALPGSDQQDTLTVAADQWAVGFATAINEPIYNTGVEAIAFAISIAFPFGKRLPSNMLYRWNTHQWPDEITPIAGIIANLIIDEKTPTGTNTIPDLTYEPVDVTKVFMEVNGEDLVYGPARDFSILGQAVTVYPANIGYNIETTDMVIFKYIRQA